MIKIMCKGDTMRSTLQGSPEELVQELVMVNIHLIDKIVNSLKLKEGKSGIEAKLELAKTINNCVKNGLCLNIQQQLLEKEITVNDVVMDALGIDMDEIQLQVMEMEALINKWLPIMDEHILSSVEMTVMQREVEEAGLTMEDFINKLIDIKVGNKEEK